MPTSTSKNDPNDPKVIAAAIEKRAQRLLDETAEAGGGFDTAKTSEVLTMTIRDARAIREG